MPRRNIVILALLAGSLSIQFGCKKAGDPDSPDKLNIVCSFLPVYVITQNVAANVPDVELHNLLPPNVGCPHNYALTPIDANRLEKADVLIINGLGMESFLEDSPFLVRENLHLIDASHEIEPIYFDKGVGHDHEAHDGDELVANPHGWVSPFVAAKMTRWIGKRLSEIDPQNAEVYNGNAARYAARLDSVGNEFINSLSMVQNRRLVTFHSAFDYLARDLNLEIVAVVLSDAGAEPSAKELAALIGEIKETRPVGIFSEPQYSDKLVRLLSEETGIPYYVLDPASSGEDDPVSYLRTMNRNLEILKTTFQLGNT